MPPKPVLGVGIPVRGRVIRIRLTCFNVTRVSRCATCIAIHGQDLKKSKAQGTTCELDEGRGQSPPPSISALPIATVLSRSPIVIPGARPPVRIAPGRLVRGASSAHDICWLRHRRASARGPVPAVVSDGVLVVLGAPGPRGGVLIHVEAINAAAEAHPPLGLH